MDAPRSSAFAVTSEDGEVVLSESYLAAVTFLEGLPENCNGADKTWVEHAVRDAKAHFARVERVR